MSNLSTRNSFTSKATAFLVTLTVAGASATFAYAEEANEQASDSVSVEADELEVAEVSPGLEIAPVTGDEAQSFDQVPSEPVSKPEADDPVEAYPDPATAQSAEPEVQRLSPDLSGLAVSPLAGTPGTTTDNGNGTSTYTHWDGETVTYPNQVAVGKPITLSGVGWLVKQGHQGEGDLAVVDGDEGSITGIKFFGPNGPVIRDPKPTNPWNGDTDYASPDVWEIIQAAGTGSWWNGATPGTWTVHIPWPSSANGAVTPPSFEPGDTFSLQLLSGTLYGNTVGSQELRPDVSRTISLTIKVAEDQGIPDPDPDPIELAITSQPATANVGAGAEARFTASATGGVAPVSIQWQRSTTASASAPPETFADLGDSNTLNGSFSKGTLVVKAGSNSNTSNRWYRAVFTDSTGKTVITAPARLSVVAAPKVTVNPSGQTVSIGQSATFVSEATGDGSIAVQWQSTPVALANGEPSEATWVNIPGATSTTFSVKGVDAGTQHNVFYRAAFTNAGGTTYSYPAQLRFTERLDSGTLVSVSGESYGANPGVPFTVTAPNAVVRGKSIIIEGSGYLAVDGKTGSVANFMIDASYSGDPNTLESTRTIINPATGSVFADPRSHGVVQAKSDGTWRIEIPWPDATNTAPSSVQKAAGWDSSNWSDFFEQNWAPGSHHTVRILTGSLLDADNQRGITVRFTVVQKPTNAQDIPVTIVRQPASQSVESGERIEFSAEATGTPAPTIQWQRSNDGGATWQNLRNATGTTYAIDAVSDQNHQDQYRAVFTNSASPQGVVTNPATLTVTPRKNLREYCGTSYGPGAVNAGIPFCFGAPEKVVFGQPIVIRGTSGYLASDDVTGSVVNFFIDAEYSGDPNTVYSKQLFKNPVTGQTISDRRTHGIVQADGKGTWKIEIPWPTVNTISTTSNGTGSYTQAELNAKFAPGTTHSIRMLTGSLMNQPADRQRGGSVYFTIVNSLDDQVKITEPLYEHQTFRADSDRAVAWLQQAVNSHQSIAVTGTGWLTKDTQWGSTVTVRLKDQHGNFYLHAGSSDDPLVNQADPTVWQIIQATETGELDARIQMPASAKSGDYLAVQLTTTDDGTALGDVSRSWTSKPVTIDNVPYVAGPSAGAACTAAPGAATYELAPGMSVPAANIGGTIRLVGHNWCNLVGGGSVIAIKINDGAYSRLATDTAPMFSASQGREVGACPAGACSSNKTIWYTIEADETGSFDVEIPIPSRKNSSPEFGEGAYTFRIMTRTLSADPFYQGQRPDPSRTMKSPEFTVVAEGVDLGSVKPGKPQASPDPLHATQDLTEAAKGGVTVTQGPSEWIVFIPGAKPGDWAYANVFQGNTPRFPWNNQWFEVGSDRTIHLPLAGATIPTGTNKLSIQDRNGDALGWTWVTVAEPAATASEKPVQARPGTSVRMADVEAVSTIPKPETAPKQPVAKYAELTERNVGDVTGVVDKDGLMTVTVPGVEGGHWVYLFLYTEPGQVIGIDWIQVGTDHTFTVDVSKLPDGVHKLALVGEDEALIGWITLAGPNPLPKEAQTAPSKQTAAVPGTGKQTTANVPNLSKDMTWTLILSGMALLVLAASATGVIVIRTPKRATN